MKEEIKSKSQIRRIAITHPDTLYVIIKTLRAENEKLKEHIKKEPCLCDSHHQYTCESCEVLGLDHRAQPESDKK